jgi:hypothetical protein
MIRYFHNASEINHTITELLDRDLTVPVNAIALREACEAVVQFASRVESLGDEHRRQIAAEALEQSAGWVDENARTISAFATDAERTVGLVAFLLRERAATARLTPHTWVV